MKKMRIFGLGVLVALWAALTVCAWFGPAQDVSESERRKLAQFPNLTVKTLLDGKFMSEFEDYTLDQFPLRDTFRQIKSLFHYYGLNQSDNNGIYLVDGTVAKLEYPLNGSSVSYATGRLQYLYDTYLQNTDCKVYSTMIPDKGYYLAEENGYPAMDYAALEDAFRNALPEATYVDLKDALSADSYYRTDTHWRQERILEAARKLCEAMGVTMAENYSREKLEAPFYGVYFGQAALPMKPEELTIMRSVLLDDCTVIDPITGTTSQVYNLEKIASPDLYDVFLSGAQPLLTIENPNGSADRELVIFRDSYGSSLTPLLLQDYSRVTMVDIRYMHPDQVESYVNFEDQDVLFAYSTLILNNGRSLK